MTGPYTPKPMDAARTGSPTGDSRFDGLRAEAAAAVAYSANSLRALRERYREVYAEALGRWQGLRDQLDAVDRAPRPPADAPDASPAERAARAAEAGADDAFVRSLRTDVEDLTDALGARQTELAKLELAQHTLERTWLFLERGDATLVADEDGPATTGDIAMRIVEAQEAERSRLAQEIHDGPAQTVSNAIFQVEYIERIVGSDAATASSELRLLRERLRRELGDIRAFISQLRPPIMDELGLDGAIEDTAERFRVLMAIAITTDLTARGGTLSDAQATVALRVAQEALQNVRKHAGATNVSVTTREEDGAWIMEIRDDGRGFDSGAVAARGRRNFGMQFMRERAELIGARFDVRSRPDGGTVVRLAIPTEGAKEST